MFFVARCSSSGSVGVRPARPLRHLRFNALASSRLPAPRCFAQQATPPSRRADGAAPTTAPASAATAKQKGGRSVERAAGPTVPRGQQQYKPAKTYGIPERLLIYHAGTGRIAFLAMLKLTTLMVGAFFTFVVVPSYVTADKTASEIAAVCCAGAVPVLFVGLSTAPFVTHIHVHLPEAARASRAVLERFVRDMPASTLLTLTTMSLIAKPRYSSVRVGELRAVAKRAGLVNYARDTAGENASRKWYMYRAVGGFLVQPVRSTRGKRYDKAVAETWVWDAVRQKVARQA